MDSAPLNGYTVVDLSVGIAGAYCTKLHADAGATLFQPAGRAATTGHPLRLDDSRRAPIT